MMPSTAQAPTVPACSISDLLIAETLGITPATVAGARRHNQETYSLLVDLEARKRLRDQHATLGRRKAGFLFALATIIGLWAFELLRA